MNIPFFHNARKTARRTAEAMAIGCSGGALLAWLGVPAGYLAGAMIAVAMASLAGRSLEVPRPLLNLGTSLLGISLGSVVSPDMMHGMSAYLGSLALLAASTVAVIATSTLYLRYVHGWDNVSAILAATPGAFAQTMVLAMETRSDRIGVAIVQSLRVIFIASLTPLFLMASGYGVDMSSAARPVADLAGIALMIACALPAGYMLRLLRCPGPWMFGAMLASGLLHGFGVVQGGLPPWLNSLALVVLGTAAGSGFSSISRYALLNYLGAGLGSVLVAFVVTAIFGFAVFALLSVRPADVFVAFAPGSIDAMMALSLALHLDPLYVGTHHILRFILVAMLTPLVVRAMPARPGAAKKEQEGQPMPKQFDPLDD